MAEYALIPKASVDTNLDDEKKALLFFCSQLLNLSEQKPESSLKEKYDSIFQRALQIPCFVLDRSQSFDHKANHSGEKCYSFQDEFMKNEVKLFLPESLKQVDLLEKHIRDVLKQDSLTVPPQKEHIPAIGSASRDAERNASKSKTDETAAAVGNYSCPTYLKCSAIQNNLGCGKCLETCFVYLPSWDAFSLEVHYIKVEVYPVPLSPGIISRIMNRGHEKIELVGTRSIMKFSILAPTAIETVNLLEGKGKPVGEEAIRFLKQANKFTILSTSALVSTESDSGPQCKQLKETSADQPTEEDKTIK